MDADLEDLVHPLTLGAFYGPMNLADDALDVKKGAPAFTKAFFQAFVLPLLERTLSS